MSFKLWQNLASAFVYCSSFLIAYKITGAELERPGFIAAKTKEIVGDTVRMFTNIGQSATNFINRVNPFYTPHKAPAIWHFWKYDWAFYSPTTRLRVKQYFIKQLMLDIHHFLRDISKSKRVAESDDLAFENLIKSPYLRVYISLFSLETWLLKFPLLDHYLNNHEKSYLSACYFLLENNKLDDVSRVRDFNGSSRSIQLFSKAVKHFGDVSEDFFNPHKSETYEPRGLA